MKKGTILKALGDVQTEYKGDRWVIVAMLPHGHLGVLDTRMRKTFISKDDLVNLSQCKDGFSKKVIKDVMSGKHDYRFEDWLKLGLEFKTS